MGALRACLCSTCSPRPSVAGSGAGGHPPRGSDGPVLRGCGQNGQLRRTGEDGAKALHLHVVRRRDAARVRRRRCCSALALVRRPCAHAVQLPRQRRGLLGCGGAAAVKGIAAESTAGARGSRDGGRLGGSSARHRVTALRCCNNRARATANSRHTRRRDAPLRPHAAHVRFKLSQRRRSLPQRRHEDEHVAVAWRRCW